ncbi:MAG: RHS repeat-associated core domain-containing protein, partial [Marinifilaceae bacterium]
NMTRDLNKGIKDIKYNELNLPESISFADGKKISYIYSATGEKLQNIVGGKTISYCGGFVYEDKKLAYILNSEGRYVVDGSDGVYEYNICDHLGNVRAVVDAAGTVKQQSNYYPFGGVFAQTGSPDNKYLYNGKEKQEGTDWSDYGARMYSADLGRWMCVDPLSESYYGLSPYGYCAGSPIACRDENGEWINFVVGAIVGAATDYAIQVATNIVKNNGEVSLDAFTSIDGGSIALSAGTGALGVGIASGISKLAKVAKIANVVSKSEKATKFVNGAVNIVSDATASSVGSFIKGEKVTCGSVGADILGGIVGRGIGEKVYGAAQSSSKANIMYKKAARAKRIAKSTTNKSRINKAITSKQKAKNIGITRTAFAGASGSNTISNTVKVVIKEDKEKL